MKPNDKNQLLHPERCRGRQQIPLDTTLGLAAYQQSSWELQRLGAYLKPAW